MALRRSEDETGAEVGFTGRGTSETTLVAQISGPQKHPCGSGRFSIEFA
jgi:hypothetical protein